MDPRPEDRDPNAPDPDVLPTDAPRGAAIIPDTNDTGMTTPPISGLGETLGGEERTDEPPDD